MNETSRQGAARETPVTTHDLSVIIVNWNTRGLLLRCLASLPAATGDLGVETIVVDNASSDDSVAAVRAAFPAVRLLALEQNRGFAGGNNAGLAAAGGRFLCLLNSDTVAKPGALAAMVAYLERRLDVGAVGPLLRNADGSEQAVGFRFPTLAQVWLDFFPLGGRFTNTRLNGRYPEQPRDRAFPIDFPLGACIVVRRAALTATGLLDEGYFMYSEEVDWCRRMRAAGWPIHCLPTAEVIHYGGQSTGQQAGRFFVELQRSRLRYYRQHHSRPFLWAARAITRCGVLKEAVVAWRRESRGALTRAQRRERVRACGAVFRLP